MDSNRGHPFETATPVNSDPRGPELEIVNSCNPNHAHDFRFFLEFSGQNSLRVLCSRFSLILANPSGAQHGASPLDERPGFAAMLQCLLGNGMRTIIVETASRFARDVIVQKPVGASFATLA